VGFSQLFGSALTSRAPPPIKGPPWHPVRMLLVEIYARAPGDKEL